LKNDVSIITYITNESTKITGTRKEVLNLYKQQRNVIKNTVEMPTDARNECIKNGKCTKNNDLGE
jgi:hypothetical protein